MSEQSGTEKRGTTLRRFAYFTLWAVAFGAFIVWTNVGFLQRVELLIGQGRLATLVIYVALWGLSIAALAIAALQTNLASRLFWAVLLAVATTVGFSFRMLSSKEISLLDVISLWNVRHETSRAQEFYGGQMHIALAVLAIGLALLLFAPRVKNALARRWIGRLGWAPLVPVILIAAIIYLKEGGGSQSLPVQFQTLSVAAVSGAVLAQSNDAERRPVEGVPGERQVDNVVYLVDESVRGDYIDWTPGNPYTPALATLRPRLADFGPALSAGVCSHYSNALLRFTASPQELGHAVLETPTIWQYAKKAGYRTVYIDAQSAFNKNADKFQNFMNREEIEDIDKVYFLPEDTPAPDLDFKLLEIVREELKSNQPVFIYANKNGAHFPYDHDYAESGKRFVPTMTDSPADTSEARINSYRNAVRWSVDGFFDAFFKEIDLDRTAVIYTSDHGQVFDPHGFTHCSVEEPDPREAVVPLFVTTENAVLSKRFAEAAARDGAGQSHFSIAPTILQLFGYDLANLGRQMAPSLLDGGKPTDFFTTGDVFGLFGEPRRHVADPTVPRLEQVRPAITVSRSGEAG